MTRTILLFAPEGPFADELRRELERLGHAVTRVHDAEAGLREAERHGPDLVLVTIELPGTSGYLVCNKLKKSPATKDTPVLLLSSESSEETFEQHRKLRTRADDYVHTPIPWQALLARMAPYLGPTAPAPRAARPVRAAPASPAPPVPAAGDRAPGSDDGESVEAALARTLLLAAEAKQWDVVRQVTSELEARRLRSAR